MADNSKDLKKHLMTLIGNNVRRYRMDRGLTQEELAARVDAEQSTITRSEGGQRMMSILMLYTMAETLNVSYDALLRDANVDPHVANITVKLSGQTPESLKHLERIIQAIIDEYGSEGDIRIEE